MRLNWFTVMGLMWVVIWVTSIATVVGDPQDCSDELWQWWDVVIPLLLTGIPLLLGYLGGLYDKNE